MENGVDIMLSEINIEIVVENEVENDKLPADGDIITCETGEINESTSKEHSGDNNEQTDKTHPLENTQEEDNPTNTQYELIDITNSITGKFNKLDLTASTCIISGCKIESEETLRCNVC